MGLLGCMGPHGYESGYEKAYVDCLCEGWVCTLHGIQALKRGLVLWVWCSISETCCVIIAGRPKKDLQAYIPCKHYRQSRHCTHEMDQYLHTESYYASRPVRV